LHSIGLARTWKEDPKLDRRIVRGRETDKPQEG